MAILYPHDDHLYDKWHPKYPDRPLLFLDVDGVINWTAAPKDNTDDLYRIVRVPVLGGWRIILPHWMKRLVHYLVDNTEVVWLTAWKELANQGLTDTLDIPKLPTLTDDEGSVRRNVDWKVAAMQPVAHQARQNGREVFWIEDFGFNSSKAIERIWAARTYDGIPEFVHVIDTLPFGAVHWDHLTGTPLEAGLERY